MRMTFTKLQAGKKEEDQSNKPKKETANKTQGGRKSPAKEFNCETHVIYLLHYLLS